MLQIKCLASWYMNRIEHEHKTDIWTILQVYTMEIWCFVYIFDGWYVRNNWCRTNPNLVLHTTTLTLLHPLLWTQHICTLSVFCVLCCSFFYRPRQAHKLSKLNWIPFILMLHYQNYSDKSEQNARPSTRRRRKRKKTIKAFFLSHIIHCLPSNKIYTLLLGGAFLRCAH